MNQDQCALCGAYGPLANGHLIPDFAVRRLRNDSPTPFFRGHDPNRRVQGARRLDLLCQTCDNNRFSDAETHFAARIFHPFLDEKRNEFDFLEFDRYFIASLIWRGIVARLRDADAPDFTYTPPEVERMEQIASALRAYLNGEQLYPEHVEQHVFFSGPSAEGHFPGINTYLTMANDLQVIATDDRLYFYAVLSGLIIIAPLKLPRGAVEEWRGGTLVVPGERICAHDQTIADGNFGGILATFAAALQDGKKAVSAKQRAVLDEALGQMDKAKFAQSRHGQALVQDYLNELSGRGDSD